MHFPHHRRNGRIDLPLSESFYGRALLSKPVYGSADTTLVKRDLETDVGFALGIWRSRGPERLADDLRKDYRIFALSESFYGCPMLYKSVYRYVDPTPLKKMLPTRA